MIQHCNIPVFAHLYWESTCVYRRHECVAIRNVFFFFGSMVFLYCVPTVLGASPLVWRFDTVWRVICRYYYYYYYSCAVRLLSVSYFVHMCTLKKKNNNFQPDCHAEYGQWTRMVNGHPCALAFTNMIIKKCFFHFPICFPFAVFIFFWLIILLQHGTYGMVMWWRAMRYNTDDGKRQS